MGSTRRGSSTNAPIPEKATRAAAQYLKTLNRMFDGDWYFALASYNAGPGRLQGAVRRSKSTDYWEITASTRYLPRETREYVPMILAAIIIAKNPAMYGFEVGAPVPLAYETVTVPGALPLSTIAEWVDLEVEHLQDLNPDLRRTTTPMTSHDLKVPVGTSATIQDRLASIDTSEYRAFKFHTVKRGETLATIARRYNLTSKQLIDANELRTAKVARNQTLMIPQRPAPALPTATAGRPNPTPAVRPMSSATGTLERAANLPRPPGRHAVQHRAPVPHDDRRPAQAQSAVERPHQDRRSPHRQAVRDASRPAYAGPE